MRSPADRIERLAGLSPRERRVLLRAWCDVLVMATALRFVPLTRLLPRSASTPRAPSPAPSLAPGRIAWLVSVARRYAPVRATCLHEALVCARLLAAEGIDAAFRIGVARHAGGVRAHAWVEHRGEILGGSPAAAETYTPLVGRGASPSGR